MTSNATTLPEGPAVLRPATSDEINRLVIPAWLSSYQHSLPAKLMRADSRYGAGHELYWSAQRLRIERILSTPGVTVTIAEIEGLPIGWACQDLALRTVHYVYVEKNLRGQGVARQMVGWIQDGRDGIVRLTHIPPPWYSQRPKPGTYDRREGRPTLWREHVIIDTFSDV